MQAALCMLAFQRGEESSRGMAGAIMLLELLETVRAWREAHSKRR